MMCALNITRRRHDKDHPNSRIVLSN